MGDRRTVPPFRQCSNCVLDTKDDPTIEFDDNGTCTYCLRFHSHVRPGIDAAQESAERLEAMVEMIRRRGRRREHDCVLGVSGGVDSTYLAYWAKQVGLRPLLVHFDNGWNSELAVHNIEQTIDRLGFDLWTFVVDWEEFRDLQRAYFAASVVDIEVLTDHGIFGALYQAAARERVEFIVEGSNNATESVYPNGWVYSKLDHVNIRAIHRQFGTRPIQTFPLLTFGKAWWYRHIRGVKRVRPLDFMGYVKRDVQGVITTELGWRDYGGKHHESIFTRFYQGYILPTKFGIDKRKAHLANLIMAGQLTREEALAELDEPICDPDVLRVDREFVLKKLGYSDEEFDALMRAKPIPHRSYRNEGPIYHRWPILRPLKPLGDRLKAILAD